MEHDPFADDPPTQPGPEVDVEPQVDPFATAAPVVGLVEASMCGRGHPNPPQSTHCATCGVAVAPDAQMALIEQPALGRLVFLDGQSLPIDRHIVLGRKPAVDDDASVAFMIDQAEVSRSHASLAVEGWAVLLTDLGSRNGTYVCPPDDPTPVRLAEGVPHFLEDGTTVHLGGSEASFTYVVNTDVASAP